MSASRGKGYAHPPATFGIAIALFGLFLWLGLGRRTGPDAALASSADPRPAPGLWTARFAAFAAAFAVVVNLFVLRNIVPVALVPFGIVAGIDLLSVLLVRQWSKRPGWSAGHRLALASGVMGLFIVASPFFEFVVPSQPGHNRSGWHWLTCSHSAG
jgi:hypothetical protein